MSEELTKITLEQLGKEYASVIDERDILQMKLNFAIKVLEILRGKNTLPMTEEEIIAGDAIKTLEKIK